MSCEYIIVIIIIYLSITKFLGWCLLYYQPLSIISITHHLDPTSPNRKSNIFRLNTLDEYKVK